MCDTLPLTTRVQKDLAIFLSSINTSFVEEVIVPSSTNVSYVPKCNRIYVKEGVYPKTTKQTTVKGGRFLSIGAD